MSQLKKKCIYLTKKPIKALKKNDPQKWKLESIMVNQNIRD